MIRAGIYAWAIGGVLALVIAAALAVAAVSLVVIPLVLALFPAAVLMPVADRLKRRLPPALAATCVLVGFVAVLV
ncbi:MAG TPA: hypothetical protein VML96_04995, partial [Egibacteraceae bacterium]|nr:hypothetical protein [Egibacteraceae bacterium]